MNPKFYITSTLPYTNSEPHIGFALEIIQTDVIARYHQALGKTIFFNTGTDEHGLKIYRKAIEQNKNPQDYVDEYAAKFAKLKTTLNLSNNSFIRTTDHQHLAAAQAFWKRCDKNGDIYKKLYRIKYCVGCELEKTESELVDQRCPIHPNLTLETVEEKNYFFRFSKYQAPLLKLYAAQPDLVLPASRMNEIKKFVENGLNDFSVSRLHSKMPWGIPVPDDPTQVMFVWFDALVGYISALGWPENLDQFNDYWPGMQTAGKDNLRQQSAIWQAMLLSAGLPTSKQILIHGFINIAGQKISKSLGNTIDPFQLVKKYGADPVRYYLLREIPSNEDGDFSEAKLVERYNGDLANNLGNLVSRVAKLIETKLNGELIFEEKLLETVVAGKIAEIKKEYEKTVNEFRLHETLAKIWELFSFANSYIDTNKPWADTDPAHLLQTLTGSVALLVAGAKLLWPFLPATAEKIYNAFGQTIEKPTNTYKVIKTEPLFPGIK